MLGRKRLRFITIDYFCSVGDAKFVRATPGNLVGEARVCLDECRLYFLSRRLIFDSMSMNDMCNLKASSFDGHYSLKLCIDLIFVLIGPHWFN